MPNTTEARAAAREAVKKLLERATREGTSSLEALQLTQAALNAANAGAALAHG